MPNISVCPSPYLSSIHPSICLIYSYLYTHKTSCWNSLIDVENFKNLYFYLLSIWTSQVVLVVKNPPTDAGNVRHMGSIPGFGKMAWQPTPVFLPGESHGQRSLAGYHPWGCRVRQDWSDLACTIYYLSAFHLSPGFKTHSSPAVVHFYLYIYS